MKANQILSWALGIVLVIGAATGSIYWIFFRAPVEATGGAGDVIIDTARKGKDLAKEIAGDIKDGMNLNGRITVGDSGGGVEGDGHCPGHGPPLSHQPAEACRLASNLRGWWLC